MDTPDSVRGQTSNETWTQLLRSLALSRPERIVVRDPTIATCIALKLLARRVIEINNEIADLDQLMEPLVAELAPILLALLGVRVQSAREYLVMAGDYPEQPTAEAGFAMLLRCRSHPRLVG